MSDNPYEAPIRAQLVHQPRRSMLAGWDAVTLWILAWLTVLTVVGGWAFLFLYVRIVWTRNLALEP